MDQSWILHFLMAQVGSWPHCNVLSLGRLAQRQTIITPIVANGPPSLPLGEGWSPYYTIYIYLLAWCPSWIDMNWICVASLSTGLVKLTDKGNLVNTPNCERLFQHVGTAKSNWHGTPLTHVSQEIATPLRYNGSCNNGSGQRNQPAEVISIEWFLIARGMHGQSEKLVPKNMEINHGLESSGIALTSVMFFCALSNSFGEKVSRFGECTNDAEKYGLNLLLVALSRSSLQGILTWQFQKYKALTSHSSL